MCIDRFDFIYMYTHISGFHIITDVNKYQYICGKETEKW